MSAIGGAMSGDTSRGYRKAKGPSCDTAVRSIPSISRESFGAATVMLGTESM